MSRKTPTVSILTPSQDSRREFLKILKQVIEDQTYSNITEWVIVNGTKDEHLEDSFREFVNTELQSKKFKTVFVSTIGSKKTIGSLRNIGNRHVKGDIIVCMDDDDYYFPKRVSSTVRLFKKNPSKNIAGTDSPIGYDVDMDKIVGFRTFHENHGTNGTMAYRREYIEHHQYSDDKVMGEELEFTNNFTEPMIQVPPEECMIVFCHLDNTFNKKALLYNYLFHDICQRTERIEDFVRSRKILRQYKHIFDTQRARFAETPYDVVYVSSNAVLTGLDPPFESIQDNCVPLIEHCLNWTEDGLKVGVYMDIKEKTEFKGIDFIPITNLTFCTQYKNVILWDMYGIKNFGTQKFKAERVFWEVGDCYKEIFQMILDYPDNYDKVVFRNEYQIKVMEVLCNTEFRDREKCIFINPGTRTLPKVDIQRNRWRFCAFIQNSFIPDSFKDMVKKTFLEIRRIVPVAELHIYVSGLINDSLTRKLSELVDDGVCFWINKMTVPILSREFSYSNIMLVPYTETKYSHYGIGNEAFFSGCVPLLTNINAFSFPFSRGLYIKGNMSSPTYHTDLAQKIVSLVTDGSIDKYRDDRDTTIETTWKQNSNQWSVLFA